ncbi:MAG: PBP1A family penicillin-binding protein [Patescibacteria group bacterium]|nr:PBP1A family penicillin-binding protein [Patescibacteria group bacterium]
MPKRFFKKIINFLEFVLAFVVLIAAGSAAVFLMSIKDLPRPEKFGEGLIAQSAKIYDRTGEVLLYEIAGEEKRTLVPLSNIPLFLQQAVLATEDRAFYQHKGVNLKSIVRAILLDLKIQKPAQGASTISQQLIRSYFLTQKKTIKRKTQEIILAMELERRYSKEQILEWYLNLIPFGSNLYGVEAASQAYFNKPIADVSLAQAASLTALIKSPTLLSPWPDPTKLLARKDLVLNNMAEVGYISQEQVKQEKQEKIDFAQKIEPIKAPHFVMMVKDYLEKKYGTGYLATQGLKITTTLDYDLQEKAEKTLSTGVKQIKQWGANNGGLVAMNPKTGEILAMVGSKDYFGTSSPAGCTPGLTCKFDPQVNTTLALRQPGSAFKPFAYAAAFYKGFTPDTLVWDVPTEFNQNCAANTLQEKDKYGQKCYHPQNYTKTFSGQISMRSALAQSRNLPSVKVLYLAGIKDTINLAGQMGISTLKDPVSYGLALVLGGGEVKLLEMTSAYSVFANNGLKTPVNFIREITDDSDNVVESMNAKTIRVLPSDIAQKINDVLSDNAARTPMFGANSALFVPGYDTAAKSGTTQDERDGWTIGYSPNLAVGVWVGNNNNASMTKSAVSVAAPIWKDFMLKVLPGLPQENFIKPQNQPSGKPVLDGASLDSHCILFYVNKNNPLGSGNSQSDLQFHNWEQGVRNWLGI